MAYASGRCPSCLRGLKIFGWFILSVAAFLQIQTALLFGSWRYFKIQLSLSFGWDLAVGFTLAQLVLATSVVADMLGLPLFLAIQLGEKIQPATSKVEGQGVEESELEPQVLGLEDVEVTMGDGPSEAKNVDQIPVQLSKTCCDWWTSLCKHKRSTMKEIENSATQPDIDIQKGFLPGRTSLVILSTCVLMVLVFQIVVPTTQPDFRGTSSSTTPNRSNRSMSPLSKLSNSSMVSFLNKSDPAMLSSLICRENYSKEENGCSLGHEIRGNFSSCSDVASRMCGSEASGIGEAVVQMDGEILCKWHCSMKKRRMQERRAAVVQKKAAPAKSEGLKRKLSSIPRRRRRWNARRRNGRYGWSRVRFRWWWR